ncbi:MAG TPA: MerR family transcriptional regulator, partial [Gammaproteobacteria bacterium]|nr:MerR family transcriptional regulator [Gammaproteobacteria bacterium]
MSNEMLPVLTGMLLDEENTVTLAELCHACAVHAEWILELVDEGVLEPVTTPAGQYRFPAVSLQRALTIRHLQRDLGIN